VTYFSKLKMVCTEFSSDNNFCIKRRNLILLFHFENHKVFLPHPVYQNKTAKYRYSLLHITHIQNIIEDKAGNMFRLINPLTSNDDYSGRTAPLTSKRCILYIYSTNRGTEYFKHCIYSRFFPLQNAVCFINLTYLVPLLFTFYIEGLLKLKKIIPTPKG